MTVRNIKTKAEYEILHDLVINSTNGENEGQEMVVYAHLRKGIYVRDKEEFIRKFEHLNGKPITENDL